MMACVCVSYEYHKRSSRSLHCCRRGVVRGNKMQGPPPPMRLLLNEPFGREGGAPVLLCAGNTADYCCAKYCKLVHKLLWLCCEGFPM